MSAIILGNKLAHYEALGRGKPLLFLHDWLGSWRYWVPTMIEISSSYRAYALDFWGFGDSDKATAYYNIASYARQVESFLDQMGISRVPLIGHGLGGITAVNFAQLHPDRVESIMMVSTPLSVSNLTRTLSGFSGAGNPAKTVLGRRLKAYDEVNIEASKIDGRAVTQSIRSFAEYDLSAALRELSSPILMVHGSDDPIVHPPKKSVLNQLGYNVFMLFLEGTQHYPMLDATTKFDRLLMDFLIHRDDWDKLEIKDEWKRRMR